MQQETSRTPSGEREQRPNNLVEAVLRNVERNARKDALVMKVDGAWEGITYGQLNQRVKNFAAGLASLGVEGGSSVAIMAKNRPEWPIADLAIQSLGATTVPVYPTLEGGQVAHILGDSEAVIAVVEDEHMLEKVRQVRDRAPGLKHALVVDDATAGGAGEDSDAAGGAEDFVLRFRDVEKLGEESPLAGWEEGWRSLGRDDVATIIYTSGTTGLPKGVVLTHGNFLSNLEGVVEALPLREDDVYMSFLPLSHVFERSSGHFLALSLGATTYYAESIEKVPDNLREVKPTVMLSVPRLYEKMYDRVMERIAAGPAVRQRLFQAAIADGKRRYAIEKEGGTIGRGLEMRLKLWDRLVFGKLKEAVGGRARFFVAGGAKLGAEIGEFFHAAGIKLLEGYGLTETSPTIACNRLEKMRFGTVGLPLYNVEVKISEDGEILTRGPHVMQGYLNNEKATAEAFTEDGWFRTGDVGELDDHGYLQVTDRAKNILVLSTGKNVAPQPIETRLVSAPHISQSVVLGDGRKFVSALIIPDYDLVRTKLETDASNEQLAEDSRVRDIIQRDLDEASRDFADYERPKKFVLLPRELSQEDGELTPTLKVKMRVVRDHYSEQIESMYA